MAQAQDSERAAAVLLDRASFRYVDESERGLEAEAGSAAPASGSRVDDVSLSVAPGRCLVLCGARATASPPCCAWWTGWRARSFPAI